ncbi:Lipopolysaccharide export system ATP-binding protein LptB [Candidatus Thermoflexus japonica]|uniref:Lipopolysaccharide export system ATP-binding protein LptB n=1 Tax=Candidatus Thermoflexus japonica TaxID=2035417 RepID=A0A2H5Y4X6_9CHLR|nr:Lipopolysaccharide export system ATP-binding protein LptB [Candidatus Thermoflexus japonica]
MHGRADVAVLVLDQVSRDFGGLRAVDCVSLQVAPGERRAIIGPNGAGKTTLFNLITGELAVTSGRIFLFGQDVTALPTQRRAALGLGRTYQITRIFPTLTVRENVLLAAMGLQPIKFALHRPLLPNGPIWRRTDEVLERVGLAHRAETPARALSHGEQRQLELAIALAGDPRLLLLDEPGAGLSPAERQLLYALIQSLPRTLTVILIEHDMDLALGLADRVTCLHYGRVIAEDTPDRISKNEMVQQIYLGSG